SPDIRWRRPGVLAYINERVKMLSYLFAAGSDTPPAGVLWNGDERRRSMVTEPVGSCEEFLETSPGHGANFDLGRSKGSLAGRAAIVEACLQSGGRGAAAGGDIALNPGSARTGKQDISLRAAAPLRNR